MSDDEEERDRSEASQEECQHEMEEASSESDASFGFDDEYNEAFSGVPVPKVLDADGLPRPAVDDITEDAWAPPYLPSDNQVCAEIATEYVIRGERGKILRRYDPKLVDHAPDGTHWVDDKGVALRVEPLRPRCKHYVLQLVPPPPSLEGALKFGDLHRYCAARRSVAGAFLGLKDAALKACSLRDPYDQQTSDILTQFDAELEAKAKKRTLHPMFLDKVSDEIFGTEKKDD